MATSKEEKIPSKSKALVVAAIDFGTMYSGYAFSLTQDWKKPYTFTWYGGNAPSYKNPTVLLLDSNQEFVAFGYDAEDQYSKLTAKKVHEEYYYFQRFKMILHQDLGVKKDILCTDELETKKLPASMVFAHCIRFLKDHLLTEIKKSFPRITKDEIDYVLTVPAIWGERAKRFMREAAKEAGIKERLIIALEPEAASIYCQHLTKDNEQNSSVLGQLGVGEKYMVVDLGGGTADITVHQQCEDHTLEEIVPASGGPWGGKSVDDRFIGFLEDISGPESMVKYKEKYMYDFLDIHRQFEVTKRSITPEKTGNVSIRIPLSFVQFCKNNRKVKNCQAAIEVSPYKGVVQYEAGKLKWTVDYFKQIFFKETIDSIVGHIEKLLKDAKISDTKAILMVGGFSECKLVQQAIIEKCTGKKVIIPIDAGLAVVKGAVYFGHDPKAISRRVAMYTYGIQTWPEFKPTLHPLSKKYEIDGKSRCKDVFFPIVRKGEKIPVGLSKPQIFRPLFEKGSMLHCSVYISDDEDPKYIDESGCDLLGTLEVPLLNHDPANVEVEETLYFGETELRVTARDLSTNKAIDFTFDIL